jgi:uncharacterized phosphosugar-binding protein
MNQIDFTFPEKLDLIKKGLYAQQELLKKVSNIYADAIMDGGFIHVYANGHSKISIEETVIRMGALTGFHPFLQTGFTSFSDVVGTNGIRVCQQNERYEGIATAMLDEYDFGPKDVMVVIMATGTTTAAVDMAIEFEKRYPDLFLIAIASKTQSREANPKHSSGKNFYHVVEESPNALFIDNSMPYGDLSVTVEEKTDTYQVCPLSSVGPLSVIQSLNELTIRELDSLGYHHHVLRNMHISNTSDNYNEWLYDQRKRYAWTWHNPSRVEPIQENVVKSLSHF